MEISSLLSHDDRLAGTASTEMDSSHATRLYTTRRSSAMQESNTRSRGKTDTAGTPNQRKVVFFWLVVSAEREEYHRLPLRVHVQPHDETQSIIQTVRGFFGLPDKAGVSFEDQQGDTIIPRYDNFANVSNDDAAHVRVIQEARCGSQSITIPNSPIDPPHEGPFEMLPPFQPSRCTSRNAKRDSVPGVADPSNHGSPTRTFSKMNLSLLKTADPQGEYEAMNGLSESEAGSISVSSSRRDHLASAEISVDNILEGNRRKRAKFESSELPLFNPPQIPFSASMSSASPQRRWTGQNANAPTTTNNQYNFAYNQMMPASANGMQNDRLPMKGEYGQHHTIPQPLGNKNRTRLGANPMPPRFGNTSGGMNLPTPAPTVGSAMSDEDVALQLMRLGDASNLSNGRTSTSTADDALSGKAEVASSAEGSDDEAKEPNTSRMPRKAASSRAMPATAPSGKRKLSKIETNLPSADTAWSSVEEYEHDDDGSFKGNSDEVGPEGGYGRQSKSKTKHSKKRSSNGSAIPGGVRTKVSTKGKSRQASVVQVPPSPFSLPPSNRKNSNASTIPTPQLGADEEDLSAMPRCQRCRKSKKGCDRQRPCGRCKEAGLGAADCISEDEGSVRKGRFGRHMGVVIKKASMDSMSPTEAAFQATGSAYVASAEGNKRRKR